MATRELLRDQLQGEWGSSTRLATELGVSRQTISGWTSGKLPIHPKWFIRLAEALDMDSLAFIEAAGHSDLVAGLSYSDVLDRWNMLYPGSVDGAIPRRIEDEDVQPAPDAFDDQAEAEQPELGLAALEGQLSDERRAELLEYARKLFEEEQGRSH